MSNVREIKRRIRSVKNIAQVTRAMQMVAASKMRRAQEQVLATRPYTAKAWEVLTHLAAQRGDQQEMHPLLTRRSPITTTGLVLITSDRGLCGAYNASVIRSTLSFMQKLGHPARLISVGRRGREFMVRHGGQVIAEFSDLPPRPSVLDIGPIARTAIDDFLTGKYDEVYLVYTEFINTLNQRPTIRRLLPITPEQVDSPVMRRYIDQAPVRVAGGYIYEPDPQTLLDVLLPRFTELQIYQAVLEALASEHSARMVAMRNATENAKDLVDHLTLSYYRARQEAITKEMLDIAGGAEALVSASPAGRDARG
jgi:F-type H+-transporting ATPase subunit gamma